MFGVGIIRPRFDEIDMYWFEINTCAGISIEYFFFFLEFVASGRVARRGIGQRRHSARLEMNI